MKPMVLSESNYRKEDSIQDEAYQSNIYEERMSKLTVKEVLATSTACLGSVSFGYAIGYSSPVLKQLKHDFHWGDTELTWFNSILCLGALISALIARITVERLGRKFNIMLCSLPLCASWVLIGSAKGTWMAFIGRFLTGFGLGIETTSVPTYIAEIAPARYRGSLSNMNQLGVTFGFLLAYVTGAFVSWRWLAIVAIFPAALMAIFMMFSPETPRWLIQHGKMHEGCLALLFLRGTSYRECQLEAEEIRATLDTYEPMTMGEIKKPSVYRPLLIASILMVFQQFSGINAVFSYAMIMLDDAGISNPEVAEISLTVMQIIATAVSCLIVDKVGRRILLIVPGAIMSISMVMLGAGEHYKKIPKEFTMVFLCLYIIGLSIGWGPLPWTVMSEVLSTRIRARATSLATAINWLCNFLVLKFYMSMKISFGVSGLYIFFASVCCLSAVYVFFVLPETKGKTLEEVEKLFKGRRKGLLAHEDSSSPYGTA